MAAIDPARSADIRCVSAVTLATHDMRGSVAFYETLGFKVSKGGGGADFTTFEIGPFAFNLIRVDDDTSWSWWGRVIFCVSDVDGMYRKMLEAGIRPDFSPRDAPWGERYFHATDPAGHEISFAAPLAAGADAAPPSW